MRSWDRNERRDALVEWVGKDVRVSPSSPGRPDGFILFSHDCGPSKQNASHEPTAAFRLRNRPSKPNSQKTQGKGVRTRTTTTPWILTNGESRGKERWQREEMGKGGDGGEPERTGWSRTGQKPRTLARYQLCTQNSGL